MKHTVTLVIIATLLFVSLCSATNGTRLVGFGTKMNGRGGTGIGVFDSPSLMMTNPAGLSFLEGSSFGINFAILSPSPKFKNNLNDATGDKNYFPIGGLGYAGQMPCKCEMAKKFSWGIGVFTQGGMGVDYALKHAVLNPTNGSTTTQKYHSMLSVLQAGPSLAYKITPKFSVGTSLHLMYSSLEFTMPYSMSPLVMKGLVPGTPVSYGQVFANPAKLNYQEVTAAAEMKDLTALGFGARLGFAYQVNDRLSLGLNYASPTSFNYKKGKANLDLTPQFNDAQSRLYRYYLDPAHGHADSAAYYTQAELHQMQLDPAKGFVSSNDLNVKLVNPQSLGIGVGFKATPKLNLAMDVEWLNWKEAYDKMELTLTNGNNDNINQMVGADNLKIDFPLQWKDAVMVRVGGEYLICPKTTLRLGWAYGSNPVPSSTLFSIFPPIIENHLTMGASHYLTNNLSAHFAFEYAFNNKQTSSTPSLIAREYDGSVSQLSGTFFNIGLAWEFCKGESSCASGSCKCE